MPDDKFDWTPERVAKLRELDGSGHSFAVQGEIVGGASKSTVARMRKKLNMTARLELVRVEKRPKMPSPEQVEIIRHTQAGFSSEETALVLGVSLALVRVTRQFFSRHSVPQLGELALAQARAKLPAKPVEIVAMLATKPAITAPAPLPHTPPPPSSSRCCFPMWPTGSRPLIDRAHLPLKERWEFCGEPATMKRDVDGNMVPDSYCATHKALCRTAANPRRDGFSLPDLGARVVR